MISTSEMRACCFRNLPEPNDVVEAEQSTGGGWFFSVAD